MSGVGDLLVSANVPLAATVAFAAASSRFLAVLPSADPRHEPAVPVKATMPYRRSADGICFRYGP